MEGEKKPQHFSVLQAFVSAFALKSPDDTETFEVGGVHAGVKSSPPSLQSNYDTLKCVKVTILFQGATDFL